MEIISIGNELLIGKTLNTNTHWLTKRITSLGLNVNRITVVGDDVDKIAKALKETVGRSPQFVITTGGLGPTFDDKTFEGIAKAFNSTLKVDKKAIEMVKSKYVKYAQEMGRRKFELTPARVKMAKIPECSEPLSNPIGTAPAIKVCQKELTVFALPGVPSEMKAIFDESIAPILKKAAGDMVFYETSLFVSGIMESEMAPFIDEVMHDNPYIYLKSHPMGAERKPQIELHMSATATNGVTAKKRVGRAMAQLTEIIQKKGCKIRSHDKRT